MHAHAMVTREGGKDMEREREAPYGTHRSEKPMAEGDECRLSVVMAARGARKKAT